MCLQRINWAAQTCHAIESDVESVFGFPSSPGGCHITSTRLHTTWFKASKHRGKRSLLKHSLLLKKKILRDLLHRLLPQLPLARIGHMPLAYLKGSLGNLPYLEQWEGSVREKKENKWANAYLLESNQESSRRINHCILYSSIFLKMYN